MWILDSCQIRNKEIKPPCVIPSKVFKTYLVTTFSLQYQAGFGKIYQTLLWFISTGS